MYIFLCILSVVFTQPIISLHYRMFLSEEFYITGSMTKWDICATQLYVIDFDSFVSPGPAHVVEERTLLNDSHMMICVSI